MKKIFHVAAILMTGSILWACSPKIHPPTSQQIDQAVKENPDANSDIIQMGFQVYTNKCGTCHELHKPAEFMQTKWENDILPMMGKKAKLTDQEYNQVKAYVFAFSKDKQVK